MGANSFYCCLPSFNGLAANVSSMDMSDKIPDSTDGGSGHKVARANGRDSLFLAGKLKFEGINQSYDVRIRNLSATGMMAECPAAVSVGQLVVVETKGIGDIPARVAWALDGRIGIAFDKEINPQLARNPGKAPVTDMLVPDYLKNRGPATRPGLRRT